MTYSTEIAIILAKQLQKFATLNRHQIVGQLANLDFWLDEVRHGLGVLDGYGKRFERMREAQAAYVAKHQTIEFDPDDTCIQGPARRPQRIPNDEFRDARKSLTDALYRFLVRCYNEKLIDESMLRQCCGDLNIGIEATDLKHR